MAPPLALIVDDEPDIRELLEITLGRMQIDTLSAPDLGAARRFLGEHAVDLCLTDMRLPDGDGIDLVRWIGEHHPQMPVAVITAHGNMETAVEALKAGAFDFVSKPVDLKVLRRLIEAALKLEASDPGNDERSSGQEKNLILGQSKAIEHIRKMVKKLARSQAPVYISGESGTGKELAARMIHLQGPRKDGEFVAVNCGAIPQELMESEFFGHKKGSFTGAATDKLGLFQTASGGTLFLDEVADLPLHMQVKLLRAIQEKSVRPVGAQKEAQADVRIISATHKNLAQMVDDGQFRQDLFYRINVIQLHIPPLRERPEDIPVLTQHVLKRVAQRNETPAPVISPEAMRKLQLHPFPGNVRELENLLERAVTLAEGDTIEQHELLLPAADTPSGAEEAASPALPIHSQLPLEEQMENIERAIIVSALDETRWNRTAAAKKLGISFRALRYRLSKLGIG